MTHADIHRAGGWALATACLTLAPHAGHLPPWISACTAALLAWQALRLRARAAPPSRLLRFTMLLAAVAIAAGIRLHYGYFFGKDPGLALLTVLLCLKLLEGRTPRDVRASVLLALFLQLGLFLNDQSLPVAALALCGTLCATATLAALEEPAAPPARTLRTGAVLMLQAVPFLLVLFVLFPRVPGPLWGLPADAHSGVTGLSDRMEPGSIAELTQSDAVALRAEFDGPPPPPAQRYWRGPVLTDFDGRTWRAPVVPALDAPPYVLQGPRHDYVVTLEPHRQRWLPALDFPGPTGRTDLRHAADLRLLSDRRIDQRTRLALTAWPETPVGLDEAPDVLERARRLPAPSSPRTREAMTRLAAGADGPETVLRRAIDFLRAQRLTYTLTPPLLGEQPVDEFLFDTRRGFCEHFSSAFAVMLRAAGLPARVVTGYQGGTINRFDGTLVVRQSDAHAWVEVWLDGRGWVRVDPTALAAPARIERGLFDALPADEARPFLMRGGFAVELLRGLRDRWEALSNAWNRNVVGFDRLRQRGLLERLGLDADDPTVPGLLLVAGLALPMLALVAWAMRQRVRRDALDRAWRAFCARLARRGLARLPSEGPIDYAERVARALPASAPEVRRIAALYAALRYGASPSDTDARLRELTRSIRFFRPR